MWLLSRVCGMENRRQCTLEGRGVTFNDRLALTGRQGLDLLDRTFPIEWITINCRELNDFVSFWSNVLPRTRKCQTWRKCTLQHNYTAAVADIHRQPLLFMNESRLAQTALRLFRVCSWKFSESHSSMHHEESSASPGPINCCLLVAATSTTRCPVVSLRLPQKVLRQLPKATRRLEKLIVLSGSVICGQNIHATS